MFIASVLLLIPEVISSLVAFVIIGLMFLKQIKEKKTASSLLDSN
jgi:UPF0716 family protein affecting phage T7 exclusion